MEPFIDFGVLELLGIFALAGLSRDARRRFLSRLAGARLGRCIRCMIVTAIGLSTCSVAVVWLGPRANPFVRVPIYIVGLAFMGLAVLHVSAILYRELTRLENRVARIAGGCNCNGNSYRTERRGR